MASALFRLAFRSFPREHRELTEAEAVEAFEFDARWKYACGGLDFDYPGFVHTVLVDMRARLERSERPKRIFEVTLDAAREAGCVSARRVLDSTPLYDAVATQDTVTMIRSAIRQLLAAAGPVLAGELRELFDRADPVPAEVVDAGRASLGWRTLEAELARYAGGRYEELRHLTARAGTLGYRVRGGSAVCQVWERGGQVGQIVEGLHTLLAQRHQHGGGNSLQLAELIGNAQLAPARLVEAVHLFQVGAGAGAQLFGDFLVEAFDLGQLLDGNEGHLLQGGEAFGHQQMGDDVVDIKGIDEHLRAAAEFLGGEARHRQRFLFGDRPGVESAQEEVEQPLARRRVIEDVADERRLRRLAHKVLEPDSGGVDALEEERVQRAVA